METEAGSKNATLQHIYMHKLNKVEAYTCKY